MRYSYHFQSSGIWVKAAATYSTELEAASAAKAIGLPYFTVTVFKCTCNYGGSELGPWHNEKCNSFVPF